MLPFVQGNSPIFVQYVPVVVRPATRDADVQVEKPESSSTSSQTTPEIPLVYDTLKVIASRVAADHPRLQTRFGG